MAEENIERHPEKSLLVLVYKVPPNERNVLLLGLKSILPDILNLFSLAFNFASTFSKSSEVKKSDVLKKPADELGAI